MRDEIKPSLLVFVIYMVLEETRAFNLSRSNSIFVHTRVYEYVIVVIFRSQNNEEKFIICYGTCNEYGSCYG